MKLSAIVLTYNEERNIADCLSALSWADEMLVVDSGSTDATVALSEKYGARVITHPFADFAAQRNFAIAQAKGDWVLFIDADERVLRELAEEIKTVTGGTNSINLTEGLTPLCVYAIPFQTVFFGKRLRFGDARGDFHVRLFPRAMATWARPVHEQVVTDLPCRKLKCSMFHYTTRDLRHYMEKVERYVPREIASMKEKGIKPGLLKAAFVPPARFFHLYFWKLGVLDGIAGFQYAILSAYFYTFQKYWRYWKEQQFNY